MREIINIFERGKSTALVDFLASLFKSPCLDVEEKKKKELANISVNYVLQLSFINLITEC